MTDKSKPPVDAPLGPGSVSVVLPVRNEERHLRACLESVRQQTYDVAPMEILVSDGRSDDGTRDVVRSVSAEDPRVRLIDNPGMIVPTAMNAAIRAARGEYIVRVDGHAAVPADYVQRVMDCFAETGAECVGGRMDARGEGYWGEVISRITSHPFGVGGSRFHYSSRPGESDTVYLGSYKRADLLELGLYDERFVRNQDDELNYRLRRRGGRVWFDPRIRADYVNRASLAKMFSQYRQYGFWKVRLYRKHPTMFSLRHAVPAAALALWAVGFPLLGLWPKVGAALLIGLPLAHMAFGLLAALTARYPLRFALSAPLAFLLVHAAYGYGSWQGLLDAVFRRRAFRPDAE